MGNFYLTNLVEIVSVDDKKKVDKLRMGFLKTFIIFSMNQIL